MLNIVTLVIDKLLLQVYGNTLKIAKQAFSAFF